MESHRQASGTNTNAPSWERYWATRHRAEKSEEEQGTEGSGNHNGGKKVVGDRQLTLIMEEWMEEEGIIPQVQPADEETTDMEMVGEKIEHIVNEKNGEVLESCMFDETVRQCEDLVGVRSVMVIKPDEKRWKRRACAHNNKSEESGPTVGVGDKRKKGAVEETHRAAKYTRKGEIQVKMGEENVRISDESAVAAAQHHRTL